MHTQHAGIEAVNIIKLEQFISRDAYGWAVPIVRIIPMRYYRV